MNNETYMWITNTGAFRLLTCREYTLFIISSSKCYFQQNTTMEQYQEKDNTL